MGLQWGVFDITMYEEGLPLPIGAHGEMSLIISAARKLLEKMLGADRELTKITLERKLKSQMQMHIKNTFSREINSLEVSIFDLEQYMVNVASLIMVQLAHTADDYGFVLEKFTIDGFQRPVGNSGYERLLKLRTDSALLGKETKVKKAAEIEAKRMDIDLRAYEALKLNYSKSQERMYDIMQKLAENEGSGSNLRNDLLGLGMGFGMAAPVGGLFTSIVNGTMNPTLLDERSGSGAMSPGGEPVGPSDASGSGGIPPMIDIRVTPPVPLVPRVPEAPAGTTPDAAPSVTPTSESNPCPECGKPVPPGRSFCGKCGADLRSRPRCSNCGAIMDADDLFCGKCGCRREET